MWGQIVIGPPGSGKSTFCHGMQQFLQSCDRKVHIVNLDPANDSVLCDFSLSITELVSISDIMKEQKLGPNGALIHSFEFLEKNLSWLESRIESLRQKVSCDYIIFDCPGQVELYIHHYSFRNIMSKLTKKIGIQLTVVNLIDSMCCLDPSRYISALLLSLCTMLHLEFPHINILSKIDNLNLLELPLDLSYYKDASNLSLLLENHFPNSSDLFLKKHSKLTQTIAQLVEDMGLVIFQTLDVSDQDSMKNVLDVIDTSNGYSNDHRKTLL